jgi:hypothetical protein
MKESMFVHESKSLKYLIHNISNFGFREMAISIFHQLVQIALHKLKHKKQFIIFANDLFKLHDVRMIKLLQALKINCQNNMNTSTYIRLL